MYDPWRQARGSAITPFAPTPRGISSGAVERPSGRDTGGAEGLKSLEDRYCHERPAAYLRRPCDGADTMNQESCSFIDDTVDHILPELLSLYLHFHRNPELSEMEEQTGLRLGEELAAAGCRVTVNIGGYGVAGVMANGNGMTVLVRADMDALPVAEATGLEYASTVVMKDWNGREVPVMHACGHDIHMAILVGVARVLDACRDRWKGTAIFIGQPSEERVSGARAMMENGLYGKTGRPDYALALHVAPEYPLGTVRFGPGVMSAGAESIDITIRGVGGHAAHPDKTRDPVLVAAQTILALQAIVSREVEPLDVAVLTVSSVHGGSKHNAIPDEVQLRLNIRFFKEETRERMLASIHRIVAGTAAAAGIPPEIAPEITVIDERAPPIENDPVLTARVQDAVAALLGGDAVGPMEPSTGSEDFAYFSHVEPRVPICYFRLGTGPADGRPTPFLHNSRFAPPSAPTLRTGTRAMAAAVLGLLGADCQEEE